MNVEVLVVDDHKLVCQAIAALVEKSGHARKVHIALSGAEALEILKTKHIKVVLVDVRMPGMSGLELAKIILHEHQAVRVIGMTSFEDDTVMDMLRAPVHGMLLKGNTNGEEISKCLFEVLNERTYYAPDVQAKINGGGYNLKQPSRTTLTKRAGTPDR